jgi:hypothetical protein
VDAANANHPVSLDSALGYVHRTSALRGESQPPLWSSGGAPAVAPALTAEEAWGIRGVLYRVISDCHFAVHLNHFIPGFLSYPVPVSLQ